MAKLGLKNTSKRINKKNVTPKKDIEEILDSIHEEKLKQMTVRMPESLHKKMKAKCALDGKAINKFIVSLIEDALLDEDRLDL